MSIADLANLAVSVPRMGTYFWTSEFGRSRILAWSNRSVIMFTMTDVTQILNAIQQGDPAASEDLLPFVYEELRVLAR